MEDYSDCVLRLDLKGANTGKWICHGLHQCLCAEGVKCSFYASSKEYYRDKKTGYVHKKGEKKNEKIHI